MHWVLAATLICGASVFTACSSNEDNHAMPDGNTPGIAMIVKNGQIDYWRQIETAFRGICQEKGMEAYYYATTSDNAYQEQASAVKELRKLGSEALKAIVFAPCYGVHDESTETEVAVFAMAPGPGIERADAFKVLKPAATVYPIGDNAISEVQSALAEFDDFVFFNGSPLLDVLPMLKAAGKRVYTFDAYGDFLDELIAGSPCLRGVMAQNTFGMTRKAVEAAIANAKQGEMVPTFYINGFNLDDPSVQPFLDFYGKQVPVIEGLSEKVLGKWILSEVEGHPLPTNDKVVFTFAENNQFFLSMSRVDNTDEYLKWDNRIHCQLKKEGNTFTITGSTADGNIEAVMKVLSITDTELLADMDFTIVASDSTHHEKMTQLYTRTPDYTEAILGLWEGRISSEQSVYDDNLDHRWEYKDDGTYLYYRHTSDGQ